MLKLLFHCEISLLKKILEFRYSIAKISQYYRRCYIRDNIAKSWSNLAIFKRYFLWVQLLVIYTRMFQNCFEPYHNKINLIKKNFLKTCKNQLENFIFTWFFSRVSIWKLASLLTDLYNWRIQKPNILGRI